MLFYLLQNKKPNEFKLTTILLTTPIMLLGQAILAFYLVTSDTFHWLPLVSAMTSGVILVYYVFCIAKTYFIDDGYNDFLEGYDFLTMLVVIYSALVCFLSYFLGYSKDIHWIVFTILFIAPNINFLVYLLIIRHFNPFIYKAYKEYVYLHKLNKLSKYQIKQLGLTLDLSDISKKQLEPNKNILKSLVILNTSLEEIKRSQVSKEDKKQLIKSIYNKFSTSMQSDINSHLTSISDSNYQKDLEQRNTYQSLETEILKTIDSKLESIKDI